MNMRRTLLALGLLSLVNSMSTLQAQAPTTPGMVYVSFIVREGAGRPITGLRQGDFRVVENGVEHSISFMEEDVQEHEYRVGYVPLNSVADGRWRRIQIRVVHPLVAPLVKSVSPTMGYYARPASQ